MKKIISAVIATLMIVSLIPAVVNGWNDEDEYVRSGDNGNVIVPYTTGAGMSIDGTLSSGEWSKTNKLSLEGKKTMKSWGLGEFEGTVDFYYAWSDDGFYIAAVIYDDYIENGAADEGNLATRFQIVLNPAGIICEDYLGLCFSFTPVRGTNNVALMRHNWEYNVDGGYFVEEGEDGYTGKYTFIEEDGNIVGWNLECLIPWAYIASEDRYTDLDETDEILLTNFDPKDENRKRAFCTAMIAYVQCDVPDGRSFVSAARTCADGDPTIWTVDSYDITFLFALPGETDRTTETEYFTDNGPEDTETENIPEPAVDIGDIDGDGEVNNKDVVSLFRYVSAGAAEYSEIYDINFDGEVNNKDVVSLFRELSSYEGNDKEYKGYVSVLKNGRYVRGDDEIIYNASLAKFNELRRAAETESDPDKRFVLFAQAEAELLDSAVIVPTTTAGGSYVISKVAPHTTPYVQGGSDNERLKGVVVADEFLTPAERNELNELWEKARKGEGTYDPAGYLELRGHSIKNEYALMFSNAPTTIDWVTTANNTDVVVLVNLVDGLVEYDNLGVLQPSLAESWTVSEDKLTYTFHIRKGVSWYTSYGEKYADVTANDFEAGFRHMLDTGAGIGWNVEGVVTGVSEYLKNGGSWDKVGCKAVDDYTLVITLERPTSYFLSMLTYSCFFPICKPFYESRGGAFGIEEYRAALNNGYSFGSTYDISSQVYCGAFILKYMDEYDSIIIEKNPNYYRAETVTLDSICWVKSSNVYYDDIVNGNFGSNTLSKSNGSYDIAVENGDFENYAFVSETDSTTYFTGFNLNRGRFVLDNGAMQSSKTEREKADTVTALNNRYFRQAIAYAFDRASFNSVVRGDDLASTNLRNMLTMPQFVQLSADTTDADGHTFKAGTFYGDLVQYYLEKMGSPVKTADGQDGWYNAENAKKALRKAKAELNGKVSWPVKIDVPHHSGNTQAYAFKEIIESVLGTENVIINPIISDNNSDYYNSVYLASSGAETNSDAYFGNGWSPDFIDPSTYLDIFAPYEEGYLTYILGLF